MPHEYECKRCGAPVLVLGDMKARSCMHNDAPIVWVDAKAQLYGEGGAAAVPKTANHEA